MIEFKESLENIDTLTPDFNKVAELSEKTIELGFEKEYPEYISDNLKPKCKVSVSTNSIKRNILSGENNNIYDGKFKVYKGTKKIIGDNFTTNIYQDKETKDITLTSEIELPEKTAKKLLRECHKFKWDEIARGKKNIKVDKNGDPYQLWWSHKGKVDNIICRKDQPQLTGKQEPRTVCWFQKEKGDRTVSPFDGSMGSTRVDYVYEFRFEDLNTYFECEFREYDNDAYEWFTKQYVCRPKSRAIAGTKELIKKIKS